MDTQKKKTKITKEEAERKKAGILERAKGEGIDTREIAYKLIWKTNGRIFKKVLREVKMKAAEITIKPLKYDKTVNIGKETEKEILENTETNPVNEFILNKKNIMGVERTYRDENGKKLLKTSVRRGKGVDFEINTISYETPYGMSIYVRSGKAPKMIIEKASERQLRKAVGKLIKEKQNKKKRLYRKNNIDEKGIGWEEYYENLKKTEGLEKRTEERYGTKKSRTHEYTRMGRMEEIATMEEVREAVRKTVNENRIKKETGVTEGIKNLIARTNEQIRESKENKKKDLELTTGQNVKKETKEKEDNSKKVRTSRRRGMGI